MVDQVPRRAGSPSEARADGEAAGVAGVGWPSCGGWWGGIGLVEDGDGRRR